jgi:hypothetical protein
VSARIFYTYGDKRFDPVKILEDAAEDQTIEPHDTMPEYARRDGLTLYRIVITKSRRQPKAAP